ncbi:MULTISPECIES: translation initiation factor IF-1 [16SrXIII (Mexican periwinkle virescence group)]|uniref:Translation initiation factor IF-1 n=2 Tax=16SrXIII (Mexican periwinkle virescence group) TaxID=85633 RepID=A0A7L8XZ54_9MOLU|nr:MULTISPECIES: translation initiation factor IF-1 [16SrXIII (Mexican periwinkle virescence group)]MBP5835673.1 translation initiation factor IF-1 [Candidatus Phytoplasma meliae]MBS2126323.1 translation initiation factor IF-1 ['Fragaria x ananassa' phyllody phytoplasma]QOI12073.1 translation initiation factor IF-1 ['Fragaria x ananassa' phyllody phytoplasma]QOI12077.1 translation initiation factor IF-1 ['Fragaria x ananassa' phyllody phytoplasma]QOI12081.1 translation initiation factor IF-1 [
MSKTNIIEMEAIIVKVLPNAKFIVELPNKKTITAYVSGKIRINHIRILPGAKVKIELSPYDPTIARITYRFK